MRALVILVFGLWAVGAAAQDRVALVMGNATYAHVPALANPVNDALDIGAALDRLGFETQVATDLTLEQTRAALRDFAARAEGAEMAVLYYAGHGVEIGGQNYMLPVDAEVRSQRDVAYVGLELDDFLRAVEGAKTLKLVLLDACRNNPFAGQMAGDTRSLGRGLAEIEPPGGVMVGYAARGGTVAYDGTGRNSPYAGAILAHLERPGLEVGKFFRNIRDAVIAETGGAQEPFTYGSLPARDIYLAAHAPADTAKSNVLEDFARASLQNTAAGWAAFLEAHEGLGTDPAILARARQAMAASQVPLPVLRSETDEEAETEAPVTVSNGSESVSDAHFLEGSPLMRACDGLAGDPEDPGLPAHIAATPLEALDALAATAACRVAVAGHAGHPRSLYQLGRALQASGDMAGAEESWALSASLGYVIAQRRYGVMLLGPNRTAAEITAGERLLTEAAASGSARAARRLGDHYHDLYGALARPNPGAAAIQALSVQYYRRAADLGDVPGMVAAGRAILTSHRATASERREALHWLTQAADRGATPAMRLLGAHYLTDELAPDRPRAIAWFERSGDLGDQPSMRQLLRLFRAPSVGASEKAARLQWAERLGASGDPLGWIEAGYVFETGLTGRQSATEAAQRYARALRAGDATLLARPAQDWAPDTARAMQAILKASKRFTGYSGGLDGRIGPATLAAMARLCACQAPGGQTKLALLFAPGP